MKIDIKEANVESNITFGDTIEMGISQDGIQHLMSTLTNLYNDPQLAVIREYYTNGLDSHVEAGQTKPVDVYLPTRDNPMYVVRDYGVGMSVADIKTIYSKYGASTKRNTNDQVGAYGLGCKSALTDAEQFTLTSVKDGIKVTAIIGKSEKGTNTIDILTPRQVDEGNGVTVTIPVKEVSTFNTKAMEFFKYSDPAKVRVNGHAPDSVLAKAELLWTDSENLKIYTQRYDGWRNPTFKVIMGDVPYDFSVDEANECIRRIKTKFDIGYSKLNVFFVVGIGDVDLTPSREGLRYTDKTKALVDKVFKLYIDHIRAVAQHGIDSVENRHDVFAMVKRWSNIIDEDSATWKGEKVETTFMHPTGYFQTVNRNGTDSNHGTTRHLNLEYKATVVHGRPTDKYKSVSMYLTSYMNHLGVSSGKFYFIEDGSVLKSKWITENENITIIHADDLVEKAKEQRKKERAALKGQLTTSNKYAYHVLEIPSGDLKKIPYDEIPAGTPYVDISQFYRSLEKHYTDYFKGNRTVATLSMDPYAVKKNKETAAAFASFSKAKQIIIIGGSLKVEALLNRVPMSYNILTDMEQTVQATFKNVPQAVRDIAALQGTRLQTILNLVKKHNLESTVQDREIRRLINPTKKARLTYEKLTEYKKNLAAIEPNSSRFRGEIPVSSEKVSDLTFKYRLIDVFNTYNLSVSAVEHIITYMNAVHAESLTPAP